MKKISYLFVILLINFLIVNNIYATRTNILEFLESRTNFYAIAGLNLITGIVDNNEIELITGATKIGSKAGLRTELKVVGDKHYIETGIDIQHLLQSIEYHNVQKTRDFNILICRIPITYNYHFLKPDKSPFVIIKIGNYLSFYPYKKITSNEFLPDYSIKNSSREMILNITCFPINNRFGFSFEGMKSFTKLYEDKYHQFSDDTKGGISGFTVGVQYKIN
jgi:hypothetical protein